MSAKKGAKRKALPTWVSVVIIVVVIGAIALIYSLREGSSINAADLPENQAIANKFNQDIKNPDYFKKLPPPMRENLVAAGRVPKEWGDGNFVEWYDSKANNATTTPSP